MLIEELIARDMVWCHMTISEEDEQTYIVDQPRVPYHDGMCINICLKLPRANLKQYSR
jgi:hypothetical protein